MKTKLALLILTLFIFSCSKVVEPPEVLYEKGIKETYKGNFNTALKLFEKIDEEYPYTEYANKSQVLLVYINYKQEEYQKLLPIADIFIKTNPNDENVPYLFFIKGLSFYTQIKDYKKDKEIIQEFLGVVRTMNLNFKNSKYTQLINEKREFAINTLSIGELDIAIQYHKEGNCIAAIPRYISLLDWKNEEYKPFIRSNLKACLNELGILNTSKFKALNLDK